MKKYLFLGLLLSIVSIMTTGCNSCQSENKEQETVVKGDYDGVIADFTIGVKNIQALHRQTMFELVDGKQYYWYETKVTFNDSIKFETIDNLKIVDVTDVFQTIDPNYAQYISSNVVKGMIVPAPMPGIWIEDFDMSNVEIKLGAEDVLQRLKEWNGIIPPAVEMTLRKPVGPQSCNAQWVIGNIMQVIFIDAVTGNIADFNPAFGGNLGMPLGEWP